MITTSAETALLMALSFLKGVGPVTLKKISQQPNFSVMSIYDIANSMPGVAKSLDDPASWTKALESANQQLDLMERHEARLLSPLDEEYPTLLSRTKDDPFLLFVKGKLATDTNKSIAIIGTREPTRHGQQTTIRISQFCAEQRWSVVSGLALGCDGIAHQATVEAKGHTVAVLAHGLHTISPAKHRQLADAILNSGGALVSQFRFGQAATPQQFVIRDKVQAGLSQGVVMIQSDVKGGSLHASRAALEYNRWLAVPYPTLVDRDLNEPKIQANLLLADGDNKDRASLLRCSEPNLDRVLILRGREDYASLSSAMDRPLLLANETENKRKLI